MNEKISELLKQNARNVSNYCTGGKYDLKTKARFDNAWHEIEEEIKEIDPKLYDIIKKQDD